MHIRTDKFIYRGPIAYIFYALQIISTFFSIVDSNNVPGALRVLQAVTTTPTRNTSSRYSSLEIAIFQVVNFAIIFYL